MFAGEQTMSSGEVLTQNDQGISTLSGKLERLIQTTRRLLRSTWVAIGLGVSIGLFLTTLVVVTLLVIAVPLWPAFRFVGLMVIAVPTIWAFVVGVARPGRPLPRASRGSARSLRHGAGTVSPG